MNLKFENIKLGDDLDRWIKMIPANDYYFDRPYTLNITEVLKAHYLIVDFFLEEGRDLGGIGPKSLDLLYSALHRPYINIQSKYKWENKYDIAATTLYGLIKNHPFHDANKRTAFLSILCLLKKSKLTPSVQDIEFENFLVEIADNQIQKRSRYKQLYLETDDPEIHYISYWLKKNTRAVDQENHIITYRDLKRILNKYDFDLQNPDKNYIDLVVKKKRLLVSGFYWDKIASIAYPGSTKQVPRGILKHVRERTKLTESYGVDSKAFYDGEDNFHLLIAKYAEPLRRLADR